MEHLYLAEAAAKKICRAQGGRFELDDLIQVGRLGLIDAANKFKKKKGVKFEIYAQRRINGSIIDYLREQHFVKNSAYKDLKVIKYASSVLENLGSEVTQKGLSRVTLIPEERIKKARAHEKIHDNISETTIVCSRVGADQVYQYKQLKELLLKVIDGFTERDQMILRLHFFRGIQLVRIGQILGMTESRVSQIIQNRLVKMKRILGSESISDFI